VCVKRDQVSLALARVTFALPAEAAIKALNKDTPMKYAPVSIFISCVCLAFASEPSLAQHASPGAHPTPSHPSSAPPPAGPEDAKVEFENESIMVVRVHMAPHEKTPMHDIASARLVVWLTEVHLRDTHPDGSANETHRRAGTIDWVGVQRHAGENLSHQPLEFLAIVPKAGRATAPR
jgi:hypothetical protein